jgi:hypothetical protein
VWSFARKFTRSAQVVALVPSDAVLEAVEVVIVWVRVTPESCGAWLANDEMVADATGILNPMTAVMSTIDTKKSKNVNIGVSLRVGFMPLPVGLLNLWNFLDLGDNAESASVAGDDNTRD